MSQCIYCEVANGLEASEGQEFVTIHRECLKTLKKQVSDALTGFDKVSNLASQERGKVYHQYKNPSKKKETTA